MIIPTLRVIHRLLSGRRRVKLGDLRRSVLLRHRRGRSRGLLRLHGRSIGRSGAGGISGLGLLLLGAEDLVETGSLVGATSIVLLLQLGEAAGLLVDVLDLALAVGVELHQLAAGRGLCSLLEVRGQVREEAGGALGDAVALVGRLGAVAGVVLAVEAGEGVEEAGRDAMLLVEVDGLFEAGVGDYVAMGKVLGQDAGAGLVLLGDLVCVAVVLGLVAVGGRVGVGGAGDGDLVVPELGVVEEEGSLGRSLLLEGDGCRLGGAFAGDLDVCDLAAVTC